MAFELSLVINRPSEGEMRLIRSAVLYTALLMGANAALADTAALEALREGSMKKLVFHAEPQPASDAAFVDADGSELSLDAFEGKYIVLNFWATWCAPCRKEMPSLANLQAELGGDSFEVVTLATGRNAPAGIRRFFEENGVEGLPQFRDPQQAVAREMAVLGLPITVILNPEGEEIARLRGDAEWDSESAKAIISALISGS
jgi:thiol-disulfide isomerase/thioredoxin